jgi:site-specific DNA-methyltransferase (adenine-specific)
MKINSIENKDALELLREIRNDYIDLMLTDIPYNEVNRKSNGLRNLDKGNADILEIPLEELIREIIRVTKGSGYIFCGFQQISKIVNLIKEVTPSVRLLVWEKSNPSPMNGEKIWLSSLEPIVYFKKPNATFNEHCKGAVLRFPTERNKLHPTQKSIKLFEYIVGVSSNEGDIVCDPFVGSGTTAVASLSLKRDFIGGDICDEYCKVAQERIKGLTTSLF